MKLCLRVEIYGCSTSHPAPSYRDLLQYNLVEPTVYSDAKYTGALSQGYLSGGQGILNDGIIGEKYAVDEGPSHSYNLMCWSKHLSG